VTDSDASLNAPSSEESTKALALEALNHLADAEKEKVLAYIESLNALQ